MRERSGKYGNLLPKVLWQGPFLLKDFMSKFPDFFSRIFSYSTFSIFFLHIGIRNLPNILPSVKFQTWEMSSVFPALPVFVGKWRGKIGKKRCSKRTALITTNILFRSNKIQMKCSSEWEWGAWGMPLTYVVNTCPIEQPPAQQLLDSAVTNLTTSDHLSLDRCSYKCMHVQWKKKEHLLAP